MKFFKKPIVIIGGVLLIIVIVSMVAFLRDKKEKHDFLVLSYHNISQEVSVTGRVKPAESVMLAFEASGKVGGVYAKVGDKIRSGQLLASLSNGDLQAELLRYKADLSGEQVKLDEMEKGTRSEEIASAQTKVSNAEKNLTDVKGKATADLLSSYSSELFTMQEAAIDAKNSLIFLTDLQYKYFSGNDQKSFDLADAKRGSILSLFGVLNGGRLSTEQIGNLEGGIFGEIKNMYVASDYKKIDDLANKLQVALSDLKNALGAIPLISDLTSAEKTNLATEKNTISSDATSVSSKQQSVATQKATNNSNITTAENTLASAKDDLNLKLAGSTPEEILAQKARVNSVLASVKGVEAKIAKTIIRAPIDGVITKQDAKLGEIVSANTNLISLISESELEMEANIPEADIAKVSLGNIANVTFDAYSNDFIVEAKVVSIYPAENIIEGVATYKTIFHFEANLDLIKPGMTANIDVLTDRRENVLAVPGRAMFVKDGKKYVQILDNKFVREVEVETGLRASNGEIEIISGLKEGDKVITFTGKK